MYAYIDREALWAYIYMRHTPNPRIEEKTILLLTIILLTIIL